jgi:hypothetical protein
MMTFLGSIVFRSVRHGDREHCRFACVILAGPGLYSVDALIAGYF